MNWVRGHTIGRGSTATVSLATANHSGEVFAIKTADLSNSEFLKREQRILSTLMCPQIVAYKGYDISSENGKVLYNLFLEYAPGGTLMDAIRQLGGRLDEARIRSYTRAILQGLEYLHCNGIVHCDIKGQNVLVTNDGAKIGDLGCARRVDEVLLADKGSVMPICGTPIYMSPEVARAEEQGFPADVWALGCTVIEMATGQPPWADVSDPVSAIYRIGFSTDVPEIPRFMSKQAVDFLSNCLRREPGERWSASELLKHEFVNETNLFLNSCYKLETPTSLLDQGLWQSVEGLEIPSWNLNSTYKRRSSSPTERIRQLSEGNSSSCSSKMLNWECDETWVTVRSNGRKEPEPEPEVVTSSQDGFLLCGNEVITRASGGNTTWVSEEYNLDIPDNEINRCITSSKSNNSRHEKSSLMTYKCMNHIILWRSLTSINQKVCFLIILSILFCWLGNVCPPFKTL